MWLPVWFLQLLFLNKGKLTLVAQISCTFLNGLLLQMDRKSYRKIVSNRLTKKEIKKNNCYKWIETTTFRKLFGGVPLVIHTCQI